MIDRAKLKAMAVARLTESLAPSPAPAAPTPATPLPAPAPRGRRRPPRAPREPLAMAPLPTEPTALQEYLLGPRAEVMLSQGNTSHSYRISRPRDYSPERPIVFVGVHIGDEWDYAKDKEIKRYEYIGLIRAPGAFMWGRKSKLSASDPRVLLFDAFYAGVRANGEPPLGIKAF